MQSDEFEKTYLAKELPADLLKCKSKNIVDIYIPEDREQPSLRIRKSGSICQITKKVQVHEGDASHHIEQTIIPLEEYEYQALAQVPSKKIVKTRYYYPYKSYTAEFDIFEEDLSGLVLVDFEFTSIDEMSRFAMPSFCLADVTQENFIAGGRLCGKSYKDIEHELKKYKYQKIFKAFNI